MHLKCTGLVDLRCAVSTHTDGTDLPINSAASAVAPGPAPLLSHCGVRRDALWRVYTQGADGVTDKCGGNGADAPIHTGADRGFI